MQSSARRAMLVTRKIVSAACRIAAGSRERLRLGNMAVRRDGGWAPEYVVAMSPTSQRVAPTRRRPHESWAGMRPSTSPARFAEWPRPSLVQPMSCRTALP
jgi:hypothetical protein